MYQIYKLTSPSGKFYIGLTKQTVKVRWTNHICKAYSHPEYNHGLYNAIRKYGPGQFTVEVLCTAPDKAAAQHLEKKHIATADKAMLYNISPGGEADGKIGSKIFWESMNADPKAKAEYLKKLSDSKLKADWSDYSDLSERALKWRKENPKEAYRLARRGLRLAMRNQPRREPDTRPLKERLMWKHKRGDVVRKNTTEFWNTASPEMRKHISEVNSSKSKARWAKVTDPKERSNKTSAARAAIDRKKQGAAASAGIKKWWAELKSDPERYAAYMAARTQSLHNTLKDKNENLRHH